MTIGESIRRYGRPALTAETKEDQMWECEERLRYYKALSVALERRLSEAEPFTKEFDTLYEQLTESVSRIESYSTEACLLRLK